MNRTAPFLKTAVTATAVSFAVMALAGPVCARLSSTRQQTSRMVARAMRVSEKWFNHLNDTYGKKELYAEEISDLRREIAGYEDDILNDMAVAMDIARLMVYSRYKNNKYFGAVDDFNRAAQCLNVPDRRRYYMAKARLRSECKAPFVDAVRRKWFSLVTADCWRAARLGAEEEKCSDWARKFAKRNDIKKRLLNEALCRIRLEAAHNFLTKANTLRRTGKRDKALKLALRGIKEIGPLTVIGDTSGCFKWKSEGELQSRYERLFVQPLCVAVGRKNADKVRIMVCDRYWRYRTLVAAVLVRITTPCSDAFHLFKKAGKDDRFMLDRRIAAAEMRLWKKAGRLREFRKDYPKRYKLARRSAGKKKKRR